MRSSLPLVALLLLLGPPPGHAQLIFLKDGFVLNGKVKDEKQLVVDPYTKEAYNLRKFFLVDDGPRRFYFAPAQMQKLDESFVRADDIVRSPRRWAILEPKRIPPILEVLETSPWDEKWDRTFKFRGISEGKLNDFAVKQHMAFINSHFCEIHSLKTFPFFQYYLTEELGPEVTRKLLVQNPEFDTGPGVPLAKRIDRRFRLYHFLVHAGWLTQAAEELDRMRQQYPMAGMRIQEAHDKLLKMQVRRHFEDIQKGHRAGRHKWVREQFGLFVEKNALPKTLDDLRALKAICEAAEEKTKQIQEFLDNLVQRISNGDDRKMFREAVAAIKFELHPEALGRLDIFLEQAKNGARQEKPTPGKDGKAELSPAERLALAVSGWLLGNAASEAKVETTRRLWRGRQLALEYAGAGEGGKPELLGKISSEALPSIDEMLLILATLPPVKPDEKLPEGITQQKVNGVNYTLQLPDEYHPGRSYPVLIALHGAAEDAKTMVERLSEQARNEGYILAAPSWAQQAGGGYSFTDAEHQTVTETLRDLRKRFNVDSDRVFLFGFGGGATMAFDVGMSHPDLFAGVMPMCGSPEYFARHYWSNAQYLPFYTISGDLMGPASKQVRDLFEKWVPHGYGVMHVQYKGRGLEWFGAELPQMFDWMSRKRRSVPVTNLGRLGQGIMGDEFVSHRVTDNHFYWISSDSVDPRVAQRAGAWNPNPGHPILPATLSASINPNQNQVFINSRGFRQLTVWLARDARLDFEKPITVRLNGAIVAANRRITPSLATLLDDFSARLDRQRLFVARIDVKP